MLSAMLQVEMNKHMLKSTDLNLSLSYTSLLNILFEVTLSRSPVFSSIRVCAKEDKPNQPPAPQHLAV